MPFAISFTLHEKPAANSKKQTAQKYTMDNNNDSFSIENFHPTRQMTIVAGMMIVAVLLTAIVKAIGIFEMSDRFFWTMSTSFLLFFAVFNSVVSLGCEDIDQYWKQSIPCFIGLMLLSGLLGWFFSGLSIHEVGLYKGIYFVLGFGYLVFLSILSFMKRIVDFAEQEDWEAPKKKRR